MNVQILRVTGNISTLERKINSVEKIANPNNPFRAALLTKLHTAVKELRVAGDPNAVAEIKIPFVLGGEA